MFGVILSYSKEIPWRADGSYNPASMPSLNTRYPHPSSQKVGGSKDESKDAIATVSKALAHSLDNPYITPR